MLKHMIRVRLIQMRCPIGNRESPVCIFISDIKQGRPAFLMFKIQCLRSQRLQFSHLFQCKTCCLKSHLPPSTALYLPFFYHASCHHSSAVFSLYLLYKSTSYISIEKSTSGSLCVPDVLLIHKSIIYSFRSTSYISYRFRMDTDRSGKSYVYCGLCQMPSARGTALFFSPQSGLHPTAEAHTAR